MAYSYALYTGNGSTTQFSVPFGYISQEHVLATVAGSPVTFTWVNNSLIQMDATPAAGAAVRVYRQTPLTEPLVDFTDGSTLVAADLDTNARQSIYTQQELDDSLVDGLAGVIPNGDKGDITTSVNGSVWTIDNGAVTSAKIADGTIVDGDISPTAAIAGTKIAFTPAGNIAAATAQAAIQELDDEKLAKAGDTMTGNLDVPSINGGPISGARNRIINGDMRIDQRNDGASMSTASGSSAYTLDRWTIEYSQFSKFTLQQNTGAVTPPVGYTNYLGVTSSSAYSAISTDYFLLEQRVEGFNSADLAWGTASALTITVSFWVRSSLTGTFGGAIRNQAGTRSYPFSFTINAANTWEKKTVTIPGETSGTWLANNSIGLRLALSLGMGSAYTATAGAWAAGNYLAPTGTVSVVGTSGATFYITGVQLEPGTVATPFERRSYGQELALCQRYYEQSFDGTNPASSPGGIMAFNANGGTNTASLQAMFKVTKRATPTVTVFSNATGTSGVIRDNSGADRAATVQLVGTNSAQFTNAVAGSVANYSAQYTASAEL